METIDNEGDDVEESANSGIGKVDSYLDLCTNKTYLARHQVCMADITQKTREDEQVNVEDCSNDEEESYDENGNVKINVDRFEPHQRRSVRDATGTINAANAGTTTARAPMASASVASMEVSI
jgi:phosphatidate phosphatase PAH1